MRRRHRRPEMRRTLHHGLIAESENGGGKEDGRENDHAPGISTQGPFRHDTFLRPHGKSTPG